MQGEVNYLSSLVNDLHQLTLADAGALDYRMVQLDFKRAVETVAAGFGERIRRAGLRLTVTLPAGPVWIRADETRLQQLLHNLVENATRYTDAPGSIEVTLDENGQLTIEDTAPGISNGDRERLFDRFFRAEASRNRDLGGSGLGLAICRNIVEAHAGTISATPSPLGGIQLRITLPVDAS